MQPHAMVMPRFAGNSFVAASTYTLLHVTEVRGGLLCWQQSCYSHPVFCKVGPLDTSKPKSSRMSFGVFPWQLVAPVLGGCFSISCKHNSTRACPLGTDAATSTTQSSTVATPERCPALL